MKKILIALFAAASMIGVAHAQTNTTITQDTANTARATCFSNGGTADQCQATYDAYIQAAGTSVPNSPTTQTPQPSSGGSSGFVALAPIPGLTDIQYAPNGLAAFFNNLYKFAIGIAATLAVVEIIWGGLNISTQDSVSKKEEGKERIQNAIFGLVLVLSPVLVFSLINPNILNLSLNLPKIDLTTAPSSSTINVQGTGTVCSGYSEYRSANISTQNYCVDQFGGGWVNVDASCCAGQSSGSACCGLNSSYTAPVTAAPTPIPGGEVVYSDASKIPAGSWCYKISTGTVIKSTQFDCGPDQTSCADLSSTDKNTSSRVIIDPSCTKH